MSTAAAADLLQSVLMTSLVLGAPILAVLIAIALAINVLQTLTQLHDQTLIFVPKLVGACLVILVLLPWLLGRLAEYATDAYRAAPDVH
jgi:flagellar biosynthetic protein FliQ